MKLICTAIDVYTDHSEEIAAGAAYLDANEPGWERKIDLTQLQLSSDCRCVLGQLNGSTTWAYGHYLLKHISREHLPQLDFARSHGFTTPFPLYKNHMTEDEQLSLGDLMWQSLDNQWIALIKDRFDTGNLSDKEQS